MADMKPTFKLKTDSAGKHPLSGQNLYTGTMIVEMPDGQVSTYKAGQHNSQQKLQDDFNRMMAMVTSSVSGNPTSVKQNYGSQNVNIAPSGTISNALTSGGILSALPTYETQRANPDGTITRQLVNQQGIRQGEPFTTYAANMLDPNYKAGLDAVVDPFSGSPIYGSIDRQLVPFEDGVRTGNSTTIDPLSLNVNIPISENYTSAERLMYANTPVSTGEVFSGNSGYTNLLNRSVL